MKIINKRSILLLIVIFISFNHLTGCVSTDYKLATQTNTIDGYKKFIKKYPNKRAYFRKANTQISQILIKEIKAKNVSKVSDIIKICPNDVINIENHNYITPLIQAIDSENSKIVDILLKNGAEPNKSGLKEGDSNHRYTPLELALEKKNNKEIVESLINTNINFSYQTNDERLSYLHIALKNEKNGNFNIADTIGKLIKKGCQVNNRNKNGETPIFYAKSYDTFKIMVDSGANLKEVNNKGQTLLFKGKQDKIFDYLISQGFDINKKDYAGNTPLFFILDESSIKYFLKKGAKPYVLNRKGKAAVFNIYDKNGDYLSMFKNGVEINRSYGTKQITIAHYIMKIINDNINDYFRNTNSTDSSRLGRMISEMGQKYAKKDILSGIIGMLNLKTLKVNLNAKDLRNRTPIDYIDENDLGYRATIKDFLKEYKPGESAELFGVVFLIQIMGKLPETIDLNELKSKTKSSFLKKEIDKCKSLPKTNIKIDDISNYLKLKN